MKIKFLFFILLFCAPSKFYAQFGGEWYSYVNAFFQQNHNKELEFKEIILYPDSGVIMVQQENGKKFEKFDGIHAIGEVIDFNNPILNFASPMYYSGRFADSFYVNCAYHRNTDSANIDGVKVKIVDTLIIQFFYEENLSFSLLQHSQGNLKGETDIYGVPTDLDKSNGLSKKFYTTIKYPLDEKDRFDYNYNKFEILKRIKFEIEPNYFHRGLIMGNLISFKPMIVGNSGDTLFDSYNNTFPFLHDNIYNKLNYLSVGALWKKGLAEPNKKYYNNSFLLTKELLYGDSSNGFTNYLPSVYSDSNRIYIYCGYKIGHIVDINDLAKDLFTFYPNPAKEKVFFNVKSSKFKGNMEVNIFNIQGDVVRNQKILNDGFSKNEINIIDLEPGIYIIKFYSVKNNECWNRKLVIIE